MLKWISKKRNRKGFTLVELVVVIAILGILAAIAVPKLSKSRESAAIAAHNANVRTLESAATLALSEGSLVFNNEGKMKWSSEDEQDSTNDDDAPKKGWGDYLQSWPSIPTGLSGEYKFGEFEEKAPLTDTVYTINITSDGDITVTPDKIWE